MSRTRSQRRRLREETLAPWVVMAIILGGWALAAKFVAPALTRDALARPPAVTTPPAATPPPSPVPSVPPPEAHRLPPVPAGAESAAPAPSSPTDADVAALRERDLVIPVVGVSPDALVPSFDDRRGRDRAHEAIDILAPRGTAVVAADDGTIVKLFESRPGGTTIYQFDPSGSFCYYYAHLNAYAGGLAEGDAVERGQTIGYVGTTGNAPRETPHLHFAILRLGPEQRWWEGVPIDPYLVLR